MKICVSYVCPVLNWPQFEQPITRFISSYVNFPAEIPHELHVICNGAGPDPAVLNLFKDLHPVYHVHDNSGWDIGAFLKIASVDCDLMLFLGTNTHFKQAGWLRRLMEAYEKFGPGLYGSSVSFEICPHIRTTVFMCNPKLIRDRTWNISRPIDRYKFEAGATSITAVAKRQGLPCILVAWDGFYPEAEWRKAPNTFRKGDQSNCLMFDRHHEVYENSHPQQKRILELIAGGNKFERYRFGIKLRMNQWLKRSAQL